MKKSMLGLAALCCVSGAAMAQSSVTAFGIIDLAARSLKGADTVRYLSNEGRATSRLGFRGVEDMGGGLKAGFHIESQVNADDGSAGSPNFWQRRATVSLMGGFGEIRLGRDKSATRTLVDTFDPFGTSGMPGLNRLLTDGVDRNRMDNGVIYFLPSMGGVYGSLSLTAGEGANSSGTARSTSARLGYKAGALDVSGAYGQFGSSNKLKITALGGSYDFGGFALMGQYSTYKQGSNTRKLSSVGGSVKLGAGKLIGSYARTGGVANTKADLLAVGYDYSLSKRTSLYTTLAKIDNKDGGTAAQTFSLNGAGGASLAVGAGNSTGYEVGIRHNF
jgi:predicted porin